MPAWTPIHKIFGLGWVDFFDQTLIEVKLEVDLSFHKQLLDVAIIVKDRHPLPMIMPHGMENLVAHNLISFKSHHEPVDMEALLELASHYVNYKKQVNHALPKPLNRNEFKLFAISARFPENLRSDLTKLRDGVYEITGFTVTVTIIVADQLPHVPENAMLLLFSSQMADVAYATQIYKPTSPETSSLIYSLFENYEEDPDMSAELKAFAHQTLQRMVSKLNLEETLAGVSKEAFLQRFSPEERLKGLSPEVLRSHLSPEERLEGLPPEERLKGLPDEEIEKLFELFNQKRKEKGDGSAPS